MRRTWNRLTHGGQHRAERRANDQGDAASAPSSSLATVTAPIAASVTVDQPVPSMLATTAAPVALHTDTDDRVTDLEAQLSTVIRNRDEMSQRYQAELAEARRQAALIQDEARTNSERANRLALDIDALENDIKAARENQTLTALALSKLTADLEAMKQLRRDSVTVRSINAYLHNMRKIDTLGSGLELQAIANILGYSIEEWKLYDNHPYEIYISRTLKAGTQPIRICLNARQFGNVHYSIVLPSYNATTTLQDTDTQELTQYGNSMFLACIKAMPVAPENKVSEEYLSFTAYALRLEVCEALNTGDRSILNDHFKKVITQIEAENFVYADLDSTLAPCFAERKIIEKVKNIVVDHYFPAHINDKLETGSNGSDRSLGSDVDLELLADADISVSLKDHDASVNTFLDSVTTEYLAIYNSVSFVGNIIELQTITNMYNVQINLKAYKGNSCYGPAQYVQIFKKPLSKDSRTTISLALINAGTGSDSFLLLNDAGKPIVPQLANGTVFSACADAIKCTPSQLKENINKYFEEQKENEIKSFFKRFIISNVEYNMGGISEFDLVIAAGLKSRAEKFQAVRRSLLNITDAILEQIGKKIEKELSEWRPLQHAMSERSVLVAFIEKFRLHLIMGMLANVFAGYNTFAGENYASSSIQTYGITSSFNAVIIILTNISTILKQYATEKTRSFVVRSAQDSFVKNLPLDKLSEINIFFNNTMPMSYVNPEISIDQQALFGIWSTDTCSKITFKLKISKDEIFSVTKAEYITALVKVRNNYAAPLVACISICQVAFIGLSITDTKQQVQKCNDELPANVTSTECDTQYDSPGVAIGNFALAFLVTAILMQTEFQGPKRTCELELSKALGALKNAYKGNEGKLPVAMSELLQAFKVDATLADALTTVPQMVNIERTIFKFRQQLKAHIFALKAHISMLESNNLPKMDYEVLLLKVESIIKTLNSENVAELYKDDPMVFNALMNDIERTREHSIRLEGSSRRRVVFSAQPALSYSLSSLSGAFKFRTRAKLKT